MDSIPNFYLGRYWEAANSIVLLMFGLTFAVYVLLAKEAGVRSFLGDRRAFRLLVLFSTLGNLLLATAAWRMSVVEMDVVATLSLDAARLKAANEAIRVANLVRIGMLGANLAMYLAVISYVHAMVRSRLSGKGGGNDST